MESAILNYLDQIKVGRKQEYKNLALYPLLSTYDLDLDYLLLEEALTGNGIEIVEKDEGGSVPELKAVNKSPRMILILDGEELVGAKQNRVVNTTILIQAGSTIVIPVSCVEQGRWSYSSARFSSERRVMSPSIRALKTEQVQRSLRAAGNFMSDQAEIWNEINEKSRRRGVRSETMAMADIYERERPSIGEYSKQFKRIDSQVGAVFMINGGIAGMECFGKADSFSKVFTKLVESYALDALDWFDPKKERKVLKSQVTSLLGEARKCETEKHSSVGLGTDVRMESRTLTGFALALDHRLIHLCIFSKDDSQAGNRSNPGLARFSARRRNRRSH